MSDESEDLEDTIRQAAAKPASASGDGRSATARSIDELIAADKYLAGKRSASRTTLPIRYGRYVPGSAE